MIRYSTLILSVFTTLLCPVASLAQTNQKWRVTLEAGPVWQSRNDVQIPNNTGTRFSLNRLTGGGPFGNFRITALYDLNRKTGLRLVYAPLRIAEMGLLAQQTSFAGANFVAGTPTEGIYQFNSYRLSYWYRFHQDHRSQWRVGLTLKVRDARVALRQGGLGSSDYNLGVVPLIHVGGEHRLADRWKLLVDFDGAAAPQGRAFDLGLHLGYDLGRDTTLLLGYRTLEGGANVKQVYNFAWFNYLSIGVSCRF